MKIFIVDFQILINKIESYLDCKSLSFKWDYINGTFTLKFKMEGTRFIIVAKSNNKKNEGMIIEPRNNMIKIVCNNYIDNFEQVIGILGELKKELVFFNETFPGIQRRFFILINESAMFSNKSGIAQVNILSRKYLREHKLKDRCGAKEIALDHLFGREYRLINAPKKINAAQAKTLKNLGITAKTEKEACDKLIAALEKEGIKGMEDESLAALIDMADGILGSDEVEDDTDE